MRRRPPDDVLEAYPEDDDDQQAEIRGVVADENDQAEVEETRQAMGSKLDPKVGAGVEDLLCLLI